MGTALIPAPVLNAAKLKRCSVLAERQIAIQKPYVLSVRVRMENLIRPTIPAAQKCKVRRKLPVRKKGTQEIPIVWDVKRK